MKKLLLSLLAVAACLTVQAGSKTDVLTVGIFKNSEGNTAVTGNQYKTGTYVSTETGITYFCNMAKQDKTENMQFNNSKNAGIVATDNPNGYKIKSVLVTVASGTKSWDVYGKSEKYSADNTHDAVYSLYSSSSDTQGNKLGSGSATSTVTPKAEQNFAYFGFRPTKGAIYITSVTITYEDDNTPKNLGELSGKYGENTIVENETYAVEQGAKFTFAADNAETVKVEWMNTETEDVDEAVLTGSQVTWSVPETSIGKYLVSVTASRTKANAGTTKALSFYIDVTPKKGSEAYPYTVAEALAELEKYGATEGPAETVYVKGYVTEVTTAWDSKYNNVSFNIADTRDGAEAPLLAFRAKWGADVTPTADNNPEVGAEVLMSGTLVNYQAKDGTITKEFNAGCQIVKYTAPVSEPTLESADITINHGTYDGEIVIDYAFTIANHNGHELIVEASIDGMDDVVFAPEENAPEEPAAAPARVAGENTVIIGRLKATHDGLKGAIKPQINIKATLDGNELYNKKHAPTTTTGVNDIVADDANAPVEYYNLQGVRVANPESGLYIRVQGKKASKVLVK